MSGIRWHHHKKRLQRILHSSSSDIDAPPLPPIQWACNWMNIVFQDAIYLKTFILGKIKQTLEFT